MTTNLFQQACRIYPHKKYLSRRSVHILRAGWIRAIKHLGDRWILATKVQRRV